MYLFIGGWSTTMGRHGLSKEQAGGWRAFLWSHLCPKSQLHKP